MAARQEGKSKTVEVGEPSVLEGAVPRAILSGLPSAESVRETLAKISEPIFVRPLESTLWGLRYHHGAPVEYTDADHLRFQAEFRRDLTAMIQRLQNLKIHLAGDYCAGSLRSERSTISRDDDPPTIKKLNKILDKNSGEKRTDLSKREMRQAISLYNRLVPEALALMPSLPLKGGERALIRETVMTLRFGKVLDAEFIEQLDPILLRINRLSADLLNVSRAPLLFDVGELGGFHEHKLKTAWDEYRAIIKQLSSIYEQRSWFSPAYGGTHDLQQGPKQGSIQPQISDYQRWSIDSVRGFERQLLKTYFGERDYFDRVECTLTNSGMSAFLTGLDILRDDWERRGYRRRRTAPHVLTTGSIYFEVDSAVDKFCDRMKAKKKVVNPADTDAVIKRIKKDLPDIVFTTPLSNEFKQTTFDLGKLFRALCDPEWIESVRSRMAPNGFVKQHLTIVIDNTQLGPVASWKAFPFRHLPNFVRIIAFDSLVKFGQDGLDLGSAGLATCIGESLQGEFKRAARANAVGIAELTLHRLMLTNSRDQLLHKFRRHHRNTCLLAQELSTIASADGYLRQVHHASLPSHPQHKEFKENRIFAGGLFTLELKSDFRDSLRVGGLRDFEFELQATAAGFEKLIVHFAREAGVEINVGSSFGFNKTRIAVYKHLGTPISGSTLEPMIPHLRIAPGTENIKDIKLIGAAIRRASEVFNQALAEGDLLVLLRELANKKAVLYRL